MCSRPYAAAIVDRTTGRLEDYTTDDCLQTLAGDVFASVPSLFVAAGGPSEFHEGGADAVVLWDAENHLFCDGPRLRDVLSGFMQRP